MALNWIFNAINPDYSVITSDECSKREQAHPYTHTSYKNKSENKKQMRIVEQ